MTEKPWEATTVEEKLGWLHTAIERLGKIIDTNTGRLDARCDGMEHQIAAIIAVIGEFPGPRDTLKR